MPSHPRIPDFQVARDSDTTVFLLHGAYGSKDHFRPEIETLVHAGLRVVAWDAPGYGLSALPEGGLRIEAMAEVADEGVETLRKVTVPTLLLAGQYDKVGRPDGMKNIKKSFIPHARFHRPGGARDHDHLAAYQSEFHDQAVCQPCRWLGCRPTADNCAPRSINGDDRFSLQCGISSLGLKLGMGPERKNAPECCRGWVVLMALYQSDA